MAASAQNIITYKGGGFASTVPVVCGRDIARKAGGTCWWDMPSKHLRQRREPVRAIVVHHTAGEGNGTAVFNTLVKRGLSVHFTIDGSGRIIQHADLDHVTFHGGVTNSWSVGIEIVNRGVPPCLPRAPRNVIMEQMHGHIRPMLAFYPAQVSAARFLVRDLCDLFQLPVACPVDQSGALETTTISDERLATFRGILGHYHFKRTKIDPVPHILEEITR